MKKTVVSYIIINIFIDLRWLCKFIDFWDFEHFIPVDKFKSLKFKISEIGVKYI